MRSAVHPDQALLDDCQQWHVNIQEYNRLDADDRAASVFYKAKITPLTDRIVATRASTPEGRIAKARVFKADFGADLAGTSDYMEQFAASLCEDIIAEVRQDEALIDLCRRCVEAMAANEAIYNKAPADEDISDEIADEASAHHDAHVIPLLNEIEKTPATSLEGAVAKARIFMSDDLQFAGEATMGDTCAQFLIDLSALDLVPEVPEAPHHPGPGLAFTREAA